MSRIILGETVTQGTISLFMSGIEHALDEANVIYRAKLQSWAQTSAANERRAPLPRIDRVDDEIDRIVAEVEAEQKKQKKAGAK